MDEKEYNAANTVEQLRAWAAVKNGSMDFPCGLIGWGDALRDLHIKAADEIEQYKYRAIRNAKIANELWVKYNEAIGNGLKIPRHPDLNPD